MSRRHIPLRTSEPPRSAAMLPLTGAALEQQVRVTLIARSASAAARRADARAMGASLPRERLHTRHSEFAERHGASDAELAPLVSFVRSQGLELEAVHHAARSVVARGTVSEVAAAFQVEPAHSVRGGLLHRSHHGPVHVPEELEPLIEAVLGLDELPVAGPHVYHVRREVPHASPLEVAAHYAFPSGGARGRRIAIIELGGGFREDDLAAYARRHSITMPAIRVHGVDGATNRPATPQAIARFLEMMHLPAKQVTRSAGAGLPSADDCDAPANVAWTIETTMDLQLICALAGEAEIVVYFAPNSMQGKYHAVAAALRDEPDVISISWGAREEGKNRAHVEAIEALFEQAALQGVTVCCSSGDDGILEYPASSPYVLGCGGTHLHDSKGRPVEETVWNEPVAALACRRFCSSGGVSRIFPEAPDWQASANVTGKTGQHGRGVPDVAAKADIVAGYDTIVGGMDVALGGTSAAAPLWAGLVARLNEHLAAHGARAGYLTPLLYRQDPGFAGALRGVRKGSSGSYQAADGWNPCTGLGTPDGERLLAALEAASASAIRAKSSPGP